MMLKRLLQSYMIVGLVCVGGSLLPQPLASYDARIDQQQLTVPRRTPIDKQYSPTKMPTIEGGVTDVGLLSERSVPILWGFKSLGEEESIKAGASGFMLDGNSVLTAKHVTRKLKEIGGYIYVIFRGKVFQAVVSYEDPDSDAALLTLVQVMHKGVPTIALGKVEGNGILKSYGFPQQFVTEVPYGEGLKERKIIKVGLQDGGVTVLGKKEVPSLIQYFSHFRTITHEDNASVDDIKSKRLYLGYMPIKGGGMSGAGVVDDVGRLVGVFMAERRDMPAIGVIVPVEVINPELFKKAEND